VDDQSVIGPYHAGHCVLGCPGQLRDIGLFSVPAWSSFFERALDRKMMFWSGGFEIDFQEKRAAEELAPVHRLTCSHGYGCAPVPIFLRVSLEDQRAPNLRVVDPAFAAAWSRNTGNEKENLIHGLNPHAAAFDEFVDVGLSEPDVFPADPDTGQFAAGDAIDCPNADAQAISNVFRCKKIG
jgi:hypothetical protein